MAMKNFVIPNLEWNNHHSRHRSSASRVSSKHRQSGVVHSPLRLESLPESSHDKSPACDGLMLSSLGRVSPIRRSSSTEDDETAALLSSKSKKPVIEYRRQPRNSVLKNGLSQCDQIDGVEKIEGRKNGSVLGDKGTKSLKISIPIRKKNSDNNGKNDSAMEIIEGRQETGAMVEEEDGKRIVDKEVEDEEKDIGFMVVEKEGKEIGALVAEEEGKDIGAMATEEEGKDIGAMEEEELAAKPWNFRPRNPIRKSLNLNGSDFNFCRRMVTSKCPSQKKQQVEKKKEPVKKEDRKKRYLTMALTKEEIKEDLFLFGLRPSKKPMKRSKSVQKQLVNVFPGTCLDSIPVTADLYRVSRKDVGLI